MKRCGYTLLESLALQLLLQQRVLVKTLRLLLQPLVLQFLSDNPRYQHSLERYSTYTALLSPSEALTRCRRRSAIGFPCCMELWYSLISHSTRQLEVC